MFYCPEGVEELSQEFQPINADSMRGASMVEWFLSRRDGTIVARHEVPGWRCRDAEMQRDPVPEGRSKALSVPEVICRRNGAPA